MTTEAKPSTQHTPGPWKVLETVQGKIFKVSTENSAPRQAVIAAMDTNSIMVNTEEQAANARLIAAAPDLLAVCEAIAERYNTDDRLGGLGDWLADAIAKARGEA